MPPPRRWRCRRGTPRHRAGASAPHGSPSGPRRAARGCARGPPRRGTASPAGITLAAGTIAFCYAYFQGQFVPIKAVSAIFFVDFVLRVTVGLRFAPSGALSGLLVRHRQPEWVSSSPKRFAWTLGVTISGATAIITNANITGLLPRTLCLVCITLMWLEAVLGLCLGCQIYAFAVRRGWIARDDDMVCAGGVCELPPDTRDAAELPQRRRVLAAPGR